MDPSLRRGAGLVQAGAFDRLSHRDALRGDSTLTWDRVDLERGRIFLPGHLTKNGQDRTVPITLTLRRELQRLRAKDRVMRIQGRRPDRLPLP